VTTRAATARRADALAAERVAFVQATVVRAQRPTSVRPGDAAIILADGTIEGFVGGACAESSVRLHALRALETGEPLLLRILPGDERESAAEGAVTVSNPCLSGGGLEIFLEPRLPSPRLVVIGDTPVALALSELGGRLGFDVALVAALADVHPEDAAVVVASHGRGEEHALTAALEAGVPYVGLVASRARGAAVAASLAVDPARLALLRTPAGLDIGARTPEEIAVSILAEIVAVRRSAAGVPEVREAPAGEATAIDPVCGMTVAVSDVTPHADRDGRRVWFCSEGCRRAFQEDAARHAPAH
jgi:xanthine dehydrogenase accessory factor